MAENKQKKFLYRRVVFQNNVGQRSFQQHLNAAFNGTMAQDRHYVNPDNAEDHLIMATKSDLRGFFCANLWRYEEGQIAQVIRANFQNENVESRALPLEDDEDGNPQQYLAGKLNFVCLNNHLIVSGDNVLKPIHLERFLDTLLRRRIENLPDGFYFRFEKTIPQAAQQQVQGVKSLVLSSDIRQGQTVEGRNDNQVIRRSALMTKVIQGAQYIFGADVNLDNLPLNALGGQGEVNVSLTLDWKRPPKRAHPSEELDRLANILRHVDDDDLDVSITTRNGGRILGNELSISASKSVVHHDGMPSFDDFSDKMIGWYQELNDQGQI